MSLMGRCSLKSLLIFCPSVPYKVYKRNLERDRNKINTIYHNLNFRYHLKFMGNVLNFSLFTTLTPLKLVLSKWIINKLSSKFYTSSQYLLFQKNIVSSKENPFRNPVCSFYNRLSIVFVILAITIQIKTLLVMIVRDYSWYKYYTIGVLV